MSQPAEREPQPAEPSAWWELLAEYPLFVFDLFIFPSRLRRLDFSQPRTRWRVALYALISLAILVAAFSDSRVLMGERYPTIGTFKGLMMRAHLVNWTLLEPLYKAFNHDQSMALRLWDTLLTPGFLIYVLFASLIGMAVVARLRMARYKLDWHRALGTGMLGHIAGVSCIALSWVPLTELLICKHCVVRLILFILFNLAGWAYIGYYALEDLGPRQRGWGGVLAASLGYGLLQFAVAFIPFAILGIAIIPL